MSVYKQANNMQDDAINVFCLSHGVGFPALRSNRVVICRENHVLSYNFPHSGRWFYCCLCQQYWVAPKGREGKGALPKECPSCKLVKKARYYSCDQCNVTMIDSLGAINRKGIHITPWGTPHPHCPGCRQLPKSVTQSHACPELNGLLTTARAECPFCEAKEGGEGAIGREESGNAIETAPIESADEFLDPSYSDLEELEKKASEIKALEAEAEAREAKARERLRQVEARLRQEMSLRSEVERKSKEIEEELKRQPEIDRGWIEAAIKASEAAARFEEEKRARLLAEQARVEAESKLRETEARASEAESKLRETEARASEAESKLRETEARASEAESKLRETEAKASEAEERLRQSEARWRQEASKLALAEEKIAEARRNEENYKIEIDWIRAELEKATTAARQAEESHRSEIARITTEAESRSRQAEESLRRQYQVKVDEAAAAARATAADLEETKRRLIEAEAKRREVETRARQVETVARQLYQILKLSFSSAQQIIAGTLGEGDEAQKDATETPLDLPTNEYSEELPSETPASVRNGSIDYEDFQFSNRAGALLDAAARAQSSDEKA